MATNLIKIKNQVVKNLIYILSLLLQILGKNFEIGEIKKNIN